MSDVNITVYSTPTCGFCGMLKDFLDNNNVQYNEIDVSQDQQAAQEMVAKTGQMGVPVTIIEKDGSEEIIVGFDQAKISDILGL